MENIMRLPEFLQKVDTLTNEMSKNELTQFIYQLGRQLPEYKRYSFLSLLEDIHYSRVEIEDTTFENDVNSLIKRLESIQSKERKLDSGLNEEWDDWYNPTVPEYLFMDSEGILNDIKLGITYIHKCIDIESYSLGNRLVEALVFLEVETTGDYPECENSCYLNLATLEEYQCIDVDLNDLCNECIFLSYMANSQEERAKKIYSILEAFGLFSDRMESIMKLGKEELKDFDLFLNDWIDYLGVKENTHVENLLLEAQSLLLDENKRLEHAQKYASKHPCMIQQILENSGNPKEMFEIGKEALSTIPKSYTDRATVALFCAQNALKLTNQKEAEICWLEAFESDTTLMNYWRLRLLSKNWNEYKETVQLFYEKLYEQPKDYSSFSMFEPRLNKLHYSDYEILRWCDGIPLDETKENTNFLIPLLLLYLNPLDNNSKGIQKIKDLACDCLHVDTSFNDGTLLQKNKTQIIDDIIECRKNSIPFNDIQLVEELIDQEVRSILKHTNRKQYWKCALFIAVLGEVKGCKEEIMDCYLNEYPLHRAFHREMQTYR